MSTPTANLGLNKPTVGGDGNAWGGLLNGDLDTIDGLFPAGTNSTNSRIVTKNPTTGNALVGALSVAKAAATTRLVQFFTGATAPAAGLRWIVGADGTAEAGANAGSDFVIESFDDAGNLLATGLQIARSNGVVTLPQIPVAAGSSVVTTATLPSTAQLSMIGEVRMWAGAGDPSGVGGAWLVCDGRAISRATYATLFGVIGTLYGVGDGTTTFNLPNCIERTVIGKSASAALISGSNTLGATLGESTHVLTIGEMPAHAHPLNDPGHTHSVIYSRANVGTAGTQCITDLGSGGQTLTVPNHTTGITMSSVGSGTAHNTVQPSIVLNYIIRVQ